jgi:hypothetical protein
MNIVKRGCAIAVFCCFCLGTVHNVSADVPGEFRVCYDFACKSSAMVQFSVKDWDKVVGLFYLNADASEERQRMREAVATMESLVGKYTPTHRDVGRNWPADHESTSLPSGQMDCIDESINTSTYLKLLEKEGLLKFHLVRERAYRRSLLTQHWAAQVVETENGQHYIIDSWFDDNGELPILVSGKVWHDLGLF